jgi:heat-inducible transcriptional repressor
MEQLTPRQIQILKDIIIEYLETAQPVGSDALDRKYSIGVSPATIRNEMATLTSLGYLRQPHTSAGRIPTPKALKYYVDQLMEEKKLSLAEEVAAKEQVNQYRDDFDKLMQAVTRYLASSTRSLAVAVTEDNDVWHAGYANILAWPEFYNIDVTVSVLSLLEEARRIRELIFESVVSEDELEVLFGEETGWKNFEPVGIVACRFTARNTNGSLGVIGSMRLNFPVVIPTVRYCAHLLSSSKV